MRRGDDDAVLLRQVLNVPTINVMIFPAVFLDDARGEGTQPIALCKNGAPFISEDLQLLIQLTSPTYPHGFTIRGDTDKCPNTRRLATDATLLWGSCAEHQEFTFVRNCHDQLLIVRSPSGITRTLGSR